MKKIITGFLLVLMGLVLVACDQTQTPPDGNVDTEKPVIHGADDKTITQGTAFDPLEGVTVTDNKDTITLTLANVTGTVNVDVIGEYKLTYSVSDTAGNAATKVRTITVSAPMPLGNLTGGDFSGAALGEGWSTWADTGSGYEYEYGVADGVAYVDIKKIPVGDSQWWGVQLKYTKIILEPFVSYKLKFDVKADAERYINHQIQGGNIPGGKAYGEKNAVKVTTTWQTVEVDFYVKGAAENAELQFAMGAFATDVIGTPEEYRNVATKIYFDNITIVEGPELENSAPVITAPNLVIKVGQETPLKQGVTVIDDFTPLTPANVTVTQKEGETPFNPANPAKGIYTFDLEVADAEGLTHKVTRTITVAEPWNRPVDLTPTAGATEGWYVFEADDNNFIDVTKEGNVTAIEILEIASGDWMAMFRVDAVQLFTGKYEVSFDIKADQERDVRVALEGAGLANTFVHVTAGTEWSHITITYDVTSNQTNKVFAFWFGTLTTGRPGVEEGTYTAIDDVLTTVYLRNFNVAYEGQLVEPVLNVPTNLVVTTQEEGGWYVFESDGDWIDVTNSNGAAVVDIKAIGNDDWRAMFRVDGIDFKAGTYTIRFEVKADVARKIRVAIENAGLSNSFEHITAGTEWTTIELVYEFAGSQSNKTFAFWFGTLTTNRPGVPEGTFTAADDVLTKVYIKDFRAEFEEAEKLEPWNVKKDLVVQGEGDWGLAGTYDGWWIREVDHPNGVTNYLESSHTDGVTSIQVLYIPNGDWQSSFLVEKVMFYAGVYTITFDVKADTARKIRVAIEGAGLSDNVAFQQIEATTDWTTITLTYTFQTDQLNKAFQFWFGTLTTSRGGSSYTAAEDILTTVHFRNFNVEFAELPVA